MHGIANEGAVKAVRRHTHNGVGYSPHEQFLANDIGIAMKPLFPQPITDYGDGMTVAAPILVRPESSPENRMDSECIEIVRRNKAAGCVFCPVGDVECSSGNMVGDKPIE